MWLGTSLDVICVTSIIVNFLFINDAPQYSQNSLCRILNEIFVHILLCTIFPVSGLFANNCIIHSIRFDYEVIFNLCPDIGSNLISSTVFHRPYSYSKAFHKIKSLCRNKTSFIHFIRSDCAKIFYQFPDMNQANFESSDFDFLDFDFRLQVCEFVFFFLHFLNSVYSAILLCRPLEFLYFFSRSVGFGSAFYFRLSKFWHFVSCYKGLD